MNEINLKVEVSQPMVTKVKLLKDGFGGMGITYSRLRTRNGVMNHISDVEQEKRPVQKEIRKLFNDLKIHLLLATGQYWGSDSALEMLKENLDVIYIMIDEHKRFEIGGKRKGVLGKYTVNLNSAVVDGVEYDDISSLVDTFEEIKKEVDLFMKGKGADNKQVAIDYLRIRKDVVDAEREFSRMTREDQNNLIREAQEELGLMVVEEDGYYVISTEDSSINVKNEVVIDLQKVEVIKKDTLSGKKEETNLIPKDKLYVLPVNLD